MTPYRFVHVTTPLSEDQQAEIIALWQRGGAIIEDTESRLDQISFVAYTETDEIVGVASCQIQPGLYSALPVHTLRVFVAEHHRQSLLAFELLAHLGEALIDQSRSKGLAQAVGLSAVIETDIVNQRGAILCSRTFQFAINKFPVTFLFTGFSREGSPEYTHYFELGDLERNTASKEQPATPTAGMDLVFLGPESAETLKKDVGEILIEQRGIPSPQLDQYVAQKLVIAIFEQGVMQAVCLLVPQFIREMNATLFGLMLFPAGAKDSAPIDQSKFHQVIFEHMNTAFQGNPEEAIGLFILFATKTDQPIFDPITRFYYHGRDQKGQELRVRFFDEARVQVPARPSIT